MSGEDRFYSELPLLDRFADVPDLASYRSAPDSWALVLTDVKGSTQAIGEGRYKEVNALGVASIVAIRNAVSDLDIPFVFGGDGATLLAPVTALERIRPALRGVQRHAQNAFGLAIRAGVVPISDLRRAGHDVLVARYRASRFATFAMLAGTGLTEGERWIKDPERGRDYEVVAGPSHADFTGFECRWKPIPSRFGEVISLLVKAQPEDAEQAALIYRGVLSKLEAILEGDGRPVGPGVLQLASGAAFDAEAKLHSGHSGGLSYLARRALASATTAVGKSLLSRGWDALGFPGRTYREEVTSNTDFRKFDDTLRMVIDVTREQRSAIEEFLKDQHELGRVVYGIHSSPGRPDDVRDHSLRG